MGTKGLLPRVERCYLISSKVPPSFFNVSLVAVGRIVKNALAYKPVVASGGIVLNNSKRLVLMIFFSTDERGSNFF
jgi:hypothetical protein